MKRLANSIFILATAVLFIACPGDPEFDDYREAFVGVYDCTKSTRSFDDDQFTTEIEVTVVLDSLSENSVIVNDETFPIDENGRFELGNINGNNHDLDLSDNKIRWEINDYFPLGLAVPCYIQGDKR